MQVIVSFSDLTGIIYYLIRTDDFSPIVSNPWLFYIQPKRKKPRIYTWYSFNFTMVIANAKSTDLYT